MTTLTSSTSRAGLAACLAAGVLGLLLAFYGEHHADPSTMCALEPPDMELLPNAS